MWISGIPDQNLLLRQGDLDAAAGFAVAALSPGWQRLLFHFTYPSMITICWFQNGHAPTAKSVGQVPRGSRYGDGLSIDDSIVAKRAWIKRSDASSLSDASHRR